jgi:hypothetical protein
MSGLNLTIAIIIIVALIIYLGFLYWCYRSRKWIFKPYVPPKLNNAIQPMQEVVPLTLEQFNEKRAAYGKGPVNSLPTRSIFL